MHAHSISIAVDEASSGLYVPTFKRDRTEAGWRNHAQHAHSQTRSNGKVRRNDLHAYALPAKIGDDALVPSMLTRVPAHWHMRLWPMALTSGYARREELKTDVGGKVPAPTSRY